MQSWRQLFNCFSKKEAPPPATAISQIGTGKIGPKAQNLFDDRKKIEKTGIIFPTVIPIASDVYKEVCEASGANKAKNEREAHARIYKHPLQPSLYSQISDAAFSIQLDNSSYGAMLRADDYPLGLGLTYSGPAGAFWEQLEDKPKEFYVDRVVTQLKRVWASFLSDNYRLFTQIKGVPIDGAAMIMPIYGQPLFSRETGADNIIYTPISINFLGYFGIKHEAIFSVGAGMGGANQPIVSEKRRKSELDGHYVLNAMSNAIHSTKHTNHVGPVAFDLSSSRMVPVGLAVEYDTMALNAKDYFNNNEKIASHLNGLISAYVSDRQIYAEFAVPRFRETPELVVLQKADVSLKAAKNPDIDSKSIVAKSDCVVGSFSASTKKVRFAGAVPSEDDIKFNRENKGYLLVISAGLSSNEMKWELKHLYNAGAVVVCVNDTFASHFEFSTHLDGYFRELGIPVIGLGKDDSRQLKNRLKSDSECLAFADEFPFLERPSGFVALI